jgi:hypothetical protein
MMIMYFSATMFFFYLNLFVTDMEYFASPEGEVACKTFAIVSLYTGTAACFFFVSLNGFIWNTFRYCGE